MKISILTEKKKGVCRRAAEELFQHIPNCVINGDYKNADIVYLLPYTSIANLGDVKGKIVSLFTHYENTDKSKARLWKLALEKSYAQIFMSDTMYKLGQWSEYVKETYPVTTLINRKKIHWGTDLSTKPIVFGVCGHARPRKRPEFVQKLVVSGLTIFSNGEGWDGSTVSMIGTSYVSRKAFYERIDYLIITSELEGGPIPVLDAIAMGVPVIAPNVGWCSEYPAIRYDGSYEDLEEVCKKLAQTRKWSDFASEHKDFFEQIYTGEI
jgi:hypothetical protein